MYKRTYSLVMTMGLALMIGLSACGSGDASPPPTDTPIKATPEQVVEAVTPVAESTATVPPAEPTEPPVVEPKEGLSASDPASFVRASGNPQLVEFFAFW